MMRMMYHDHVGISSYHFTHDTIWLDSMKRWNRTSGASLTEVTATIGLVSLLGLLSINWMFDAGSWMARYRLRSAARDLYYIMRRAQMNSIMENRPWAIIFDPAHGSYLLCSDPGADNSWSNRQDNQVVQRVELAAYEGGIRFGRGSAAKSVTGSRSFPADFVSFNHNLVVFRPDGSHSTSGYCYLTGHGGATYAVGALATGPVRLKRWSGSAWQ